MQPINKVFEQQQLLAMYCRTGRLDPTLNGDPNRLQNYRELVFGNIEESLSTAFPLTKQLLGATIWDALVNDYFQSTECLSPLIWKMPLQLIAYVEDCHPELCVRYYQLSDLLKFEWLEIELFMMQDKADNWLVNSDVDFLHDTIFLNPEYRIAWYDYPVHLKIAEEIVPEDKSNYFVLGLREPGSGEVHFINISPVYVWFIESLNERAQTMIELCKEASCEFNIPAEMIYENIKPFLSLLLEKKFITSKN